MRPRTYPFIEFALLGAGAIGALAVVGGLFVALAAGSELESLRVRAAQVAVSGAVLGILGSGAGAALSYLRQITIATCDRSAQPAASAFGATTAPRGNLAAAAPDHSPPSHDGLWVGALLLIGTALVVAVVGVFSGFGDSGRLANRSPTIEPSQASIDAAERARREMSEVDDLLAQWQTKSPAETKPTPK